VFTLCNQTFLCFYFEFAKICNVSKLLSIFCHPFCLLTLFICVNRHAKFETSIIYQSGLVCVVSLAPTCVFKRGCLIEISLETNIAWCVSSFCVYSVVCIKVTRLDPVEVRCPYGFISLKKCSVGWKLQICRTGK